MCSFYKKDASQSAWQKQTLPTFVRSAMCAGLTCWCRWPDSNRHGVATGGFWVHYVCQFHHTGMELFYYNVNSIKNQDLTRRCFTGFFKTCPAPSAFIINSYFRQGKGEASRLVKNVFTWYSAAPVACVYAPCVPNRNCSPETGNALDSFMCCKRKATSSFIKNGAK